MWVEQLVGGKEDATYKGDELGEFNDVSSLPSVQDRSHLQSHHSEESKESKDSPSQGEPTSVSMDETVREGVEWSFGRFDEASDGGLKEESDDGEDGEDWEDEPRIEDGGGYSSEAVGEMERKEKIESQPATWRR